MLQVRLARHLRRGLWAVAYSMLGALVMLVIAFILYMNSRADLDDWHLVDPDEEYTEDAEIGNFNDYLQLEQRLFKQLDEMVYETLEPGRRSKINRYSRGSLSDPGRWQRNWNHSFELNTDNPRAAVLLLHGMSDSPYSHRGYCRFNTQQSLKGPVVYSLVTLLSLTVKVIFKTCFIRIHRYARNFDPERFTDNSTYEKGAAPSTGMKAVIVNGQVALRDDKVLSVFVGQPIRFEPEAKPRFGPISVEGWNKEFSTGMPDTFTGAFPKDGGK